MDWNVGPVQHTADSRSDYSGSGFNILGKWGRPLLTLGYLSRSDTTAKPQWEFPRLCRGGSKSLTYPAVDTAAPSTKLRIASRQAHEEGFD